MGDAVKIVRTTTWIRSDKDGTVVTAFSDWCGPCKRVKPHAVAWLETNGFKRLSIIDMSANDFKMVYRSKIPMFDRPFDEPMERLQDSNWMAVRPFLESALYTSREREVATPEVD